MTLHVATASAVSSGTSSSGKARWWLWQIKHQRWQLQHVFIYICKSSETTTENESQPCSADFSWSTIKAMLNTVISQQAGLIMDIMEWFKWSLVVLTDLHRSSRPGWLPTSSSDFFAFLEDFLLDGSFSCKLTVRWIKFCCCFLALP